MILTCPSCGTQYVVKDGAIPPEGRQVRCASCKHSWHQDAEVTDTLELQPAEEVAAEPEAPASEDDESLAEATLIEPRSGPEAEERAFEEATVDAEEPATADVPAPNTEQAVEPSSAEER